MRWFNYLHYLDPIFMSSYILAERFMNLKPLGHVWKNKYLKNQNCIR